MNGRLAQIREIRMHTDFGGEITSRTEKEAG
jgi:hypothetical protein